MTDRISVIIPTLNEEFSLPATLQSVQSWRRQGHEVIVADGGSSDRTTHVTEGLADRLVVTSRGRALQMNAGAQVATGDVLLFLHADTVMPIGAERAVATALARCAWGRFDVSLSGSHPLLRWVETGMNWRSRVTGIATGDQGIFVRRELFASLGGFPEIALMEDIALSHRLRFAYGRPACLRERLVTSSRRWEQYGLVSTILKMWSLRLTYALGVAPIVLGRYYESR